MGEMTGRAPGNSPTDATDRLGGPNLIQREHADQSDDDETTHA
jgi:hypothetical protein